MALVLKGGCISITWNSHRGRKISLTILFLVSISDCISQSSQAPVDNIYLPGSFMRGP